jgi:hypothetical protein
MMDEIAITIDRLDWLYKYKPIPNHFVSEGSGWCLSADKNALLFDSNGVELDYIVEIVKEDPTRVWSWIKTQEDDYYIVCGFRSVSTAAGGYFVTDQPGIIDKTWVHYTLQEAMGMDQDLTDWY